MFFLKRNQSDFLKNKSIQIHKFEKKKQYISLNRIKFNENVLSIIGRGIITNKKIIQNNASQ